MEIEFVFMNDGEFGNPCYQVIFNDSVVGYIYYFDTDNQWKSDMFHCLEAETCFFLGNKLNELNESLEKQRKEYFGLI